jgi:hypothetical protein
LIASDLALVSRLETSLPLVLRLFDFVREVTAGTSAATKTRIIPITTSSSMRVKDRSEDRGLRIEDGGSRIKESEREDLRSIGYRIASAGGDENAETLKN